MSYTIAIVISLAGFGIAALCAAKGCGTREFPYVALREALRKAGVPLER